MNSFLGFVGGVVIIAGGFYILSKTGLLEKAGTTLEEVCSNMVSSFKEGYQQGGEV